jgi:hypothetical protein
MVGQSTTTTTVYLHYRSGHTPYPRSIEAATVATGCYYDLGWACVCVLSLYPWCQTGCGRTGTPVLHHTRLPMDRESTHIGGSNHACIMVAHRSTRRSGGFSRYHALLISADPPVLRVATHRAHTHTHAPRCAVGGPTHVVQTSILHTGSVCVGV